MPVSNWKPASLQHLLLSCSNILRWVAELRFAAQGSSRLQQPTAVCRPAPNHAGVHDNIVGLRGLCSHGGELYLVMELCPR